MAETPKKDVIQILMQDTNINLGLDARDKSVIVPDTLKSDMNLVLKIGYFMNTPMKDFDLTDDLLKVKLSFKKHQFLCEIPLKAIYYILIDDSNKGIIFDKDIPMDHPMLKQQKYNDFKKTFTVLSNNTPQLSDKQPAKLKLVK